MLDSYLAVGGNQIGNNQRTLAYASHGLKPRSMSVATLCGCASLDASFEDGPYTFPDQDDAPWYDPSAPESADFAGFFIESMEGIDAGLAATFTPRPRIGATRGPLTRAGRSLVVTGWLIARTCSAVTYGLQWLTGALGGLCDPCGADVCVLSACPPLEDPDWTPYLRTMHGAGLLSGPVVTDRIGSCCEVCQATAYQVTFTIGVENPWVYRVPTPIVVDLTWQTDDVQTVQWSASCVACSPDPCAAPACRVDPPSFGQPHLCYCYPWVSTVQSHQITPPLWWSDSVLQVVLRAGSSDLRDTSISLYANPMGLAGPEDNIDTWRCAEPCAEVLVPYVPAYSSLTIDGARREARIRCPGTPEADGGAYIESFGNRWFEIGCSPTLVALRTDALKAAVDSSYGISLVARDQVL